MLAGDSPFIRTHPPRYVCPSRAEGTCVSFNTASENRCDLCRPPSCEWSLAGVCPCGLFVEVDGGRTRSVGARRETCSSQTMRPVFLQGSRLVSRCGHCHDLQVFWLQASSLSQPGAQPGGALSNWPQPKGTKRTSIRLAPSPGEAPGRAAPPPS